jgi:hypothetical protein
VDSFKSPSSGYDRSDIYSIFELYDSTDVLIHGGICYDYQVKKWNYDTSGMYTVPSASTKISEDTGVLYTLPISSKIQLELDQPFDLFIIEFPKPYYKSQSKDISCSPGSCIVTRGNNWIIYKHNDTVKPTTTSILIK